MFTVFILLQPSYNPRSHPSWLWKMLPRPAFQGITFRIVIEKRYSQNQVWNCPLRFFAESYPSLGTASLESCVADYFFSSVAGTILYADATANMCYFGDSTTTTGPVVTPSTSSWTAYIKTGMICLQIMRSIHFSCLLWFQTHVQSSTS